MIKSKLFSTIILIACFGSAQALTWEDLWLNQDQQGYKALNQNNLQQAAQLFKSSQWQGTAYYRMGDYPKALQAFMKANNATAWYNRGNALAHLGQYQKAIQAYDKALTLDPHLEDARFNADLLKQLLNNTSTASMPQETSSVPEKSPPPFKQNYKNTQNNPDNNPATPSPQDNTIPAANTPQNTAPSPDNPSQNSPTPGSPNPNDSIPSVPGTYQDQQQQQSLQNIDDDPGGLLQRKLSRDYARSQQQGD